MNPGLHDAGPQVLHPDPLRDAMADVMFAAMLRGDTRLELEHLIATFPAVPAAVIGRHYADAGALARDRYRKFCDFVNAHPYG